MGMEKFMKVTGKPIRLKGLENPFMQMGRFMKENG